MLLLGDERSRQALVKGQVGRALLDILLRQDEPTLVLAALRALKSLLAAMDSGKSRMLEVILNWCRSMMVRFIL